MSMHNHPNEEIEDKLRLASPTIYEIVAWEGREELSRPLDALAWSGLVAGICIWFSVICEAILKVHLPPGDNFLIENLGYTAGFMIVILGRFQLFTENTITVILPLLDNFKAYKFWRVMKLWGLVLACNFAGTFLIAVLLSTFDFFEPQLFDAFIDISHHAVVKDFSTIFLTGIPAGFLIATLVWMLPSSENMQFWVILFMIYIIAVGDMAHIVAGSAEAFLLILNGHIDFMQCISYLVAAAGGNIIGGTGLFAMMAYAQVRSEM